MNSAEYIAPYVGFPSFFRAPMGDLEQIGEKMAVVLGVPMDMGIVLARPGARYGPRAIREASHFYRGVHEAAAEKTVINVDTHAALRLKERPNVVDISDITVYPQDFMKTSNSIMEGVNQVVERGGLPVVLGGDHYLAYPSFEGFARGIASRKPNARIGYLHIDSHPDFRDSAGQMGRFNHGTCVRRLSENPMVSYKNIAWVGLNGDVLDADIYRIYRSQSLKMYTAKDVRSQGIDEVVQQAVEAVADGTDAIYVSVDIDVVDGSQSPGTGAPVFEGIDASELVRAMAMLGGYEAIGAIDMCEVAPPLDPTGRTPHLAAKALTAFLAGHLFEEAQLEG